MSQHWEKIIVLGGEGGRISLFGLKTLDGTWIFIKETNETALAHILVDEDLSSLVHQKSKVVTEWEQAIELLGESWTRLRPIYVHPEFKRQIWKEVTSKDDVHLLEYWERLCLAKD
ncbi:hypothetical protein [Geobacillus stearothermophilus]|uniref:hypothetical protein n=1 Tax=Geobacillus stearothermophilus TaxID=1422 RepID=UPI0037491AEA